MNKSLTRGSASLMSGLRCILASLFCKTTISSILLIPTNKGSKKSDF